MTKKYSYVVIGVGALIAAACFSVIFLDEIPYLLNSWTAQLRIVGTLLLWILGIIVLYYGIKFEKTNKLSDSSLVLFVAVPLLSLILRFFGCPRYIGCTLSPTQENPFNCIGPECDPIRLFADQLSGQVLVWGLAIAFVLLIVSLFDGKQVPKTS